MILKGKATSAVFAAARKGGTVAAAKQAARQRLSAVTSAQNAAIAALPAKTPVLYRTHAALPGFAVRTDARNLGKLRNLPGVAAVHPIAPKSFANSYAVPLVGAPAVWTGRGDLGQNTSIAIIDTGIDYTHANFGGPGTVAAFDAASGALGESASYPSNKVIGGADLVGDDYNADPTSPGYQPIPHPDDFPLDCNGHGSHVAGTAAGLGENADGSTYTGSYNNNTPFSTMKIGPGMAPAAKLYAYRVFGCEGSSDVVAAAIDMAVDPNGDGDPSDHVDVINMSLGSDWGSAQDGDSTISEAATDAGVLVAVASGNAGDLQDVGGSPGDAPKVLTVANSQDASNIVDATRYTIAGGAEQKAPSSRSVLYDWGTKPDLSGAVAILPPGTGESGDLGTACAPLTDTQKAAVTGKIALVKWTQEALECASVGRGANLRIGGAKGFIFANSADTFSAGINGDTQIPGVLMAKTNASAILAALKADQPVQVTGTTVNGAQQVFPQDDDKINDSSSRGVHEAGNVKPDVTGVGTSVFSTAVGTGTDGVSFTGTSMATPQVAGQAALIRSAHPGWTPAQVKADVMNTAGQDIYENGSAAADKGATYAPNRVGAGRIKTDAALANDVLAYNVTDDGTVSVSFGPVEATGPVTLTKTVKVENTGLTKRTYQVAYDAITTVPGVQYQLSTNSVTVDPRSSETFDVTLKIADPKALTKTVDPTAGRTSTVGYPRETLADASGRILLTSSGVPTLRVPVYSAPRPASTMTQESSLPMPGGADTATLHLSGTDVGQDGTSNGAGTSDPADDVFSIAAGFELTATSGPAPTCATEEQEQCVEIGDERASDVKYVGVTSDYPVYEDAADSQAYFAISTHGPWSTPASRNEFDVYIDTDNDGEADLIAYNTRLGEDDLFVTDLVDLSTGQVVDTELTNGRFGDIDTAAYDSDTMVMPVYLDVLADYGVTAQNPSIAYGVVSWSPFSGKIVDAVGMDLATGKPLLKANVYQPGVSVTDDGSGPLVDDANGSTLTVHRDSASYAADGGQGLLMVHFHNKVGNKAQVVDLKAASTVSASHSPEPSAFGAASTLNVTVSGAGTAPTGTVTVKEGAATVGTATLSAGKGAVPLPASLSSGTHTFTLAYSGDSAYAPSTGSATATVSPGPAVSTTTTATGPGKVNRGQKVLIAVSVKAADGSVPTGTVTITEGKKVLGTGSLSGGSVVVALSKKLKPGKHTLTVSYGGSPTAAASQTTVKVKVAKKRKKKG